jgi:hypothetical protein
VACLILGSMMGATGRLWSIPFVDFPHDVTDQFDVLTDALEDPGTDLQTVLAVLRVNAAYLVAQFTGIVPNWATGNSRANSLHRLMK